MNDNHNNEKRREMISAVMVAVGLIAIMVATFLPLVHITSMWIRYVYAVGAVTLLIGRFVAPKVKDATLRLTRLIRMEYWTALIFMAGAVFMFLPATGATDWIAFTLAGGILTVYTSIMIPRQKQ